MSKKNRKSTSAASVDANEQEDFAEETFHVDEAAGDFARVNKSANEQNEIVEVVDEMENINTIMEDVAAEVEAATPAPSVPAPQLTSRESTLQTRTVEWYLTQTADELRRLRNNVASKKSRSKNMGRTADFQWAVAEEDKIRIAIETVEPGTARTVTNAEEVYTPEAIALMSDEELTRRIKNFQSIKCLAKAMGRTEKELAAVAMENLFKAERDSRSPAKNGGVFKSKATIMTRIAQCEAVLEENPDDADAQGWIAALKWVIGQEPTDASDPAIEE